MSKKTAAVALILSGLLYYFLPLCNSLYHYIIFPFLGDKPYLRLGLFPLLALLLSLSLKPKRQWRNLSLKFFLLSTPLPVLISYFFGRLSQWPGTEGNDLLTYYWYVICIPIGEEFLFRGWSFDFFERFFPERKSKILVELPWSSWATSILFSLWHLQNLGNNPTFIVLFQVVYTFFTGLWLAEIRIKSRNPIPCCVAHSLLNLASSIP